MNFEKRTSKGLTFLLVALLSQSVFADTLWVDVRSTVEHRFDNIEGDLRISHQDIVKELGQITDDKSTEIRLYCRSGGRAGKARLALIEAGYSNVHNMGGIEDARKARANPE